MTDYLSEELKQHYLDVCEQAKEDPQPALLDILGAHGRAPNQTRRIQILEHLGEVANLQREALLKAGLWPILDALREAGYEDTRILRSEGFGLLEDTRGS